MRVVEYVVFTILVGMYAFAGVLVVLRLGWPEHRVTYWLERLFPVRRKWTMPLLFVVLTGGPILLLICEPLVRRLFGG